MAVIRFDPTWIATANYDSDAFRYDYPLESDGYIIMAFTKFPMGEIKRIISLFPSSQKYLYVKTQVEIIGVEVHKDINPPSSENYIHVEPALGYAEGSQDGDYYKLDIGEIATVGHSGPSYTSLWNIIDSGYTGFKISPYFNEIMTTNEVYVQLEGNFDNPRPFATSPLGGEVKNINEPIKFVWSHNSQLNQIAYDLRYRIKGSTTWTEISQVSTENKYHNIPENTLTENEYEWQVRTTSEYDFISPWSLTQVFNAAEVTSTPVFIQPTNNETIGVADLVIKWESPEQEKYEIQLIHDGIAIWQESKTSANKEITIESILVNHESYKIRLRVNKPLGVFSAWNEINISVDYTAPAKPILTIAENREQSCLEIDIENPTPTGTEPQATNQELYKKIGDKWVKLANLLPNSQYTDYAVASDKLYEYRVRVFGDNDTNATSDIFSGSIKIKDSILSLANNPTEFVRLKLNPKRSFSSNYNATKMNFSGRTKPVAEFGEVTELDGSLEYVLLKEGLSKFIELADKKETLLYRNNRGRKVYGIISGVSVEDYERLVDYFTVSFSFTETYYKEGIE